MQQLWRQQSEHPALHLMDAMAHLTHVASIELSQSGASARSREPSAVLNHPTMSPPSRITGLELPQTISLRM